MPSNHLIFPKFRETPWNYSTCRSASTTDKIKRYKYFRHQLPWLPARCFYVVSGRAALLNPGHITRSAGVSTRVLPLKQFNSITVNWIYQIHVGTNWYIGIILSLKWQPWWLLTLQSSFSIDLLLFNYRLPMKLRKVMFSSHRVCLLLCPQGGIVWPLRIHPHPLPPPSPQTCLNMFIMNSVWLASGSFASYWNAFLFTLNPEVNLPLLTSINPLMFDRHRATSNANPFITFVSL